LAGLGAPHHISMCIASWQRYCTASSSGHQPDFAALNRGRHPCSAGRPSGWALAHILVMIQFPLSNKRQLCCRPRPVLYSGTTSLYIYHKILECGPMPNVMVALPNIAGAFCSTPQRLADAHYLTPCSKAAKTWKPLKLAGVPQTTGPTSAATRPKFTILWRQLEEILLLNKFFPIVDMCLSCEDIARQSTMVRRWQFFGDFCVHRATIKNNGVPREAVEAISTWATQNFITADCSDIFG